MLIARLRLPALAVTLGTLSFYRGLAYVLLGDQAARGYPTDSPIWGRARWAARRSLSRCCCSPCWR